MNTEILKEFAELSQQKRDLKAELDKLNMRLDELKPIVSTEMMTNGIDKLPIETNGGRSLTVSLARIVRAHMKEGIDRSEACDALEAAGLEALLRVDFNLNTLSGYVRDQLAGGRKLPVELERGFTISDTPDVRTRVTTKTKTVSGHASDTMSSGGAFGLGASNSEI